MDTQGQYNRVIIHGFIHILHIFLLTRYEKRRINLQVTGEVLSPSKCHQCEKISVKIMPEGQRFLTFSDIKDILGAAKDGRMIVAYFPSSVI